MRRHGRLEKVEQRTLWDELMGKPEDERKRERSQAPVEDVNPIEEGIRKARERRARGVGGKDEED